MKLSDFIEELNIAIQQDGHDIYCNADTANMIKRHLKEQKKGEWIHKPDLQECEKCIFKPFKQFQPEQQWIPCSERLPENGHYYLWCSDMGSVQSDYYWDGFENGMKYGYNIVAWMPLPEAYKGEADENNS